MCSTGSTPRARRRPPTSAPHHQLDLRRRKPASVNSIAGASSLPGPRQVDGRGAAFRHPVRSEPPAGGENIRPSPSAQPCRNRRCAPSSSAFTGARQAHGPATSQDRGAAGQGSASGVYGAVSERTEWLANPSFAELVSGQSFTTRDLRESRLDLFLNLNMKIPKPRRRSVAASSVPCSMPSTRPMVGSRTGYSSSSTRSPASASWLRLMRARDAGRKYADRRADRLRARPKAAALRPRHLFPTARNTLALVNRNRFGGGTTGQIANSR